ncbi:hypothetical protein [Methanocella conradii]|uniref:hypothetical protein n=1 Tax=Methanocella conradii TaxID=1175444 RepID=UPI00157D4ED0|nr:hypothetical protein [Methanocella conradii]
MKRSHEAFYCIAIVVIIVGIPINRGMYHPHVAIATPIDIRYGCSCGHDAAIPHHDRK